MSSMAESLAQLREEKEELQMEVESLKMTGAIDTGHYLFLSLLLFTLCLCFVLVM